MNEREALKLALEALENVYLGARDEAHYEAITALRQALEKPADEPVAWVVYFDGKFTLNIFQVEHLAHSEKARLDSLYPLNKREVLPLYTRPQPTAPVIDESAAKRIATALGWKPAAQWHGLTDEEIDTTLDEAKVPEYVGSEYIDKQIARAIEAKLKEKNT